MMLWQTFIFKSALNILCSLFVAPMCPERHLDAAELLGSEVRNPKKADAGKITADVMRKFMEDVSKTKLTSHF